MSIESFQNMVDGYQAILDVLSKNKNSEGISKIPQTYIAHELDCSQTLVSKKLKVLAEYNLVVKIRPSCYKIIEADMRKNSQFTFALELFRLISSQPELVPHYQKQAELLNVNLKEIQRGWAILNRIFGSPYKSSDNN